MVLFALDNGLSMLLGLGRWLGLLRRHQQQKKSWGIRLAGLALSTSSG
ncbi:MAG: hypothetical protein V4623_03120 [Pseudomonadota bacterium]